jgi:Zn-dependent peptidase ImmA (M78 family)
VNEFRAFVIIDDYAPLIFINAKDSIGGRLFSLCHELAHIWFGENNIFNDQYDSKDSYKDKLELKCNAVAAEILVPEEHFLRKWQEDSTKKASEKIKALAKYFRVSETVIARRALDLGKITKQEYSTIYKMAIDNFNKMIDSKKERSGGDYYNTAKTRIDPRFFSVVNRSVLNGTLKYTDAYRLTGFNRKTYSEFERRL